MAFIDICRPDPNSAFRVCACLDRSDCQLIVNEILNLETRRVRAMDRLKDILEGGEATVRQTNRLANLEEEVENLRSIRHSICDIAYDGDISEGARPSFTLYTGDVAQKVCQAILANDDYTTPIEGYEVFSAGYWKDGKRYCAYDNRSGHCWVGEFTTLAKALAWVRDELDDK